MKPANKHEKREKEFINIENKLSYLYELHWNEGWIKLKTPIHRGWWKEYVLREEIKRRKYGDDLKQVLSIASQPVYGRTEKILENNWARAAKRHNRPEPVGLKGIYIETYYGLPANVQKWFTQRKDVYLGRWLMSTYFSPIVPLSYFKFSYRKAYITHKQVLDRNLEREIAELEKRRNQLELGGYSFYGGWKRYQPWDNRSDRRYNTIQMKNSLVSQEYDQLYFRKR